MRFFFSIIFICIMVGGAYAQKDTRFRYAAVHELNERQSYSIFYPNQAMEYKGVIVLIHSSQASNPKSYGGLIEHLLKQGYLVVYPAYQAFVASNNKYDIQYIASSLQHAYADIQSNYPDVYRLPVALIGHSMGGVIAFEIATQSNTLPKKPSSIIALAPAETPYHRLKNMNFNTLDSYDVYLVLEEQKDRYHRRKTGETILNKLPSATRKNHKVHDGNVGNSKHMNAWSHDTWFSSKNNTLVSYFSKIIGKTNEVDTEFYWKEIDKALQCAFSRQSCDEFTE